MTDHNKNTIIDDENDEFPEGFDDLIRYVVIHELAKRLCENIDVTEEYRKQLERGLAEDFHNTLREFMESNDDLEPISYERRHKILINRMFRHRNDDFLPFPEVDTPYERLRSKIAKNHKIKLRCIRKEYKSRKQTIIDPDTSTLSQQTDHDL